MMGQPIPTITKNLLIINGLFFLATYIFESKGIDLTVILGAFYPGSPNFQTWQVLSHMFMHGGFQHILFNMFALWMFGAAVETTIGAKNFLKLYIFAGFGGFILYNLVNYIEISQLQKLVVEQGVSLADIYKAAKLNLHRELVNEPALSVVQNPNAISLVQNYITPMVGASGAIYGLLLAFAVLYPEAKLALIFFPVGIKAKYFIPILIAVELFFGVRNFEWNNVAHFAHLGGALIGFLFVRNWKKNLYRKN
ncbi:rhomboid family intramembrane serine protease [Faecalibacter rhinopitheci]|nr:rhomboid family intramembrane serine protease [Faecalibacter rhinopitheci]